MARIGARVIALGGTNAGTTERILNSLAADYWRQFDVWREVPGYFARFVRERGGMPIEGPEGSGSYVDTSALDHDRMAGAVHCVVACEGRRHYAKYVGLMRWAEALAELRAALGNDVGNDGITESRNDGKGGARVNTRNRTGLRRGGA